ncbi:MAG: response regulator transcription factor [Oligoflexales bacterium]
MALLERERYTITLDDDPTVHLIIQQATGITSLPFTSADALIARTDHYSPVAVFIDIFLAEDVNGLEVIPEIRKRWDCPIIVITANAAVHHIGQALALGAHDFLVKPFQRHELQARLLARIGEAAERAGKSDIFIGDVIWTPKRRLLQRKNQECALTPYEALIFETLVHANGMVMSKGELMAKVWGNIKVNEGALDKKIFLIRKSLRYLGSSLEIRAEYGKGLYLFVPKKKQKPFIGPVLKTVS